MTRTVALPVAVVERALAKARNEYVRVAHAAGTDPGADDECWAEMEALADALTEAASEP